MAADAWLVQDEQEEESRRSMISTAPSDRAPAPHVWLSDRPGWCVDLGPTLRAMSASELWLALAKGDVTPETKVWREGMAYWEPAADVPEFALALPDVNVWSSRPAQLARHGSSAARAVARSPQLDAPFEDVVSARAGAPDARRSDLPPEHGRDRSTSHASDEAVRVVTLATPGDFMTPAPVVVEPEVTPVMPLARPKRWLDRRAAASMTAGAAIAITALALATTGPVSQTDPLGSGPRPAAAGAQQVLVFQAPAPVEPRSGEAPPAWVAPTGEPVLDSREPAKGSDPVSEKKPSDRPARTIPGRPATTAPATTPAKPRAPRGPHAADRGQRRVRGATR